MMDRIKIAEAELKALRAQMNPHFVYNAINSVQYFITDNDPESSQKYLAKFARLIRYVVDNSKPASIPLNTEIEALNLYLERLGDCIQNVKVEDVDIRDAVGRVTNRPVFAKISSPNHNAAAMDGAPPLSYFRYIVLPHLSRPITVVILIETIFLLNIFAEIKVTSVGGFAGNLTYLVFSQLNDANDVGAAAAGGIIAVILANIVSYFLVRIVGKNLEG